ncbi:MAG: hypothetical protein NXI04_24100 [Planctomycetaceae bacterium]|nr:hypothetical protein [Planctomycetaceae bacterium]
MKTITRNILKTIALVLIPIGLTGCQSGVSPHPFTTMFQKQPLELPLAAEDKQSVIPASLTHGADEDPSLVTAAVTCESACQ